MAHPYHHAESSVIKWGGDVKDYVAIHSWFDESKAHIADFRHRALRHHTEGIFMCESIFGVTIVNSQGRKVPVRFIGEQHVKSRSSFIIMYVKDNNVKKLISLTVGEHLRQFGDLLKEAGYSYVSFDSLDVDNIFQL